MSEKKRRIVEEDKPELEEVNLSEVAPVEEPELKSLILPDDDTWDNLGKRILDESRQLEEANKKEIIEHMMYGDVEENEEELDDDEELDISNDINNIVSNANEFDDFSDLIDDDDEDYPVEIDETEEVENTKNFKDEGDSMMPKDTTPKVKFKEEPATPEEEVNISKITNIASEKSEDDNSATNTVSSSTKVKNIIHNTTDEDFLDLSDIKDNVSDEDIREEEARKRLIEEVTSEIKPINNVVNLSKFKISKRVKKTPSVILKNTIKNNHYAWVYSKGDSYAPIVMSEMNGVELTRLNRNTSDEANNYTFAVNMLNTIYNHIISPKPPTMEQWAKTIPSNSIDDIFFAIYGAIYSKSNHVYYTCTNPDCEHGWMSEALPLSSMYETKDEGKLKDCINSTVTQEESEVIEPTLIQVSDELVFAVKIPSLYSSYIELNLMNETEIRKFGTNLGILLCVDSIYNINTNTMELEPVEFKYFKNPKNNITAKYRQINAFISILSPDQRSLLSAAINKLVENEDNKLVTYQLPEIVCPKCGTTIKSEKLTAEEILFIRVQLGAMRG